jgi:GNAT superfamily N-acetyltransferase
MTVTYQTENATAFYLNATSILSEHWDEVGTLKQVRDYAPDMTTYLEIEAKGRLLVCTARAGDKLIGYAIGIIGPDLHAKGRNICVTDIYRINPEYRYHGIGQDLFAFFADQARGKNCATMTTRQKLKDGQPTGSDEFFKRLGYQKTEIVWIRPL